ncbi:MAG: FAD-binding oxidoreductase [Ktedonobacteraceae bacterium]
MKNLTYHNLEVEKIVKEIQKFSKANLAKKLRFSHGSTNSTRIRSDERYISLDISHFNGIIEINTQEKYIVVEPNVPMDLLVSTTLAYGLLPPVVMEFPGITVGGAINGAALESSSWRYGQFNDTCLEIEIILGNGEVIRATPEKNADLFYGISGSYGTLGFISLVKLQLIDILPYIHVRFYPTKSTHETLSLLKKHIQSNDVDYIEGIIFHPENSIVIVGKLSQANHLPVKTYGNAKDSWFYEKAEKITTTKNMYEELIPIKDYLFRYNRGAFWMGEYVFPFLHLPNTRITKFLLNPFMNTRKLFDAMHAIKHSQTYFIQDFYCPYDTSEEFIFYSEKELAIYPIWLCPIKPTRENQKLSPHYIQDTMLLDIGIWGQSKKYLANPIGVNHIFEMYAHKTNARKMLYAQTYYTKEEFWTIYDHTWYEELRKKYKAEKTLPELWEKVHVSETYKVQKWTGAMKLLLEMFKGKNINS